MKAITKHTHTHNRNKQTKAKTKQKERKRKTCKLMKEKGESIPEDDLLF